MALANAKNGRILIDSHQEVINFWQEDNNIGQRCIDYLAGRMLTAEQREAYKQKRKSPITLNFLKPQERSIVAGFLKSQADIKWVPWGGRKDDELAAAMEALRIWEANQADDELLDMNSFGLGWASRRAYQEVNVQHEPGYLPSLTTKEVSRFQVYPMPGSRDAVWRRDALYYQIAGWYSEDQLIKAFPNRKEWVLQKIRERGTVNETTTYEKITNSVDRAHESKDYRNGLYRVIECYYRIDRDLMPEDKLCPSVSPINGSSIVEQGVKHQEDLWYAVVVPELSDEFLYNGPYHFQPVNPCTGKILWPIVEFAYETLNGDVQSAIEFQLEPSDAVNSLMSNILHSAKHASSQARLFEPSAFMTEGDAKDFGKYHADADRAFPVKEGRATGATKVLDHAQSSTDVYKGLELAMTAVERIGSAPPSMQGLKEGNESGVLFQNKVDQAEGQMARAIKYYRSALTMKYMLRYIAQRQFYVHEITIPILEPTETQRRNGTDTVTLNQQVPKVDKYGFVVPGETDRRNPIDGIMFNVTVVPSKRAQSYRLKTQSQINDINQNPAAANDPILGSIVLEAQIDNSDLDPKYKDMIAERRNQMKQGEAQAAQNEALVAQAAQAKGQSAMQMSEAQTRQVEATTQSLIVKAQGEQQSSIREDKRLDKDVALAQSTIQKNSADAQQSAVQVSADMQMRQLEMQHEVRMMDMNIKLKQMELEQKRLDAANKSIDRELQMNANVDRSFEPVSV